jgi:hypothetical protein
MKVNAEGRTGEQLHDEVKRRPIDFMGAALREGGHCARDGCGCKGMGGGGGSTDGGGVMDGGADDDKDGGSGGGATFRHPAPKWSVELVSHVRHRGGSSSTD